MASPPHLFPCVSVLVCVCGRVHVRKYMRARARECECTCVCARAGGGMGPVAVGKPGQLPRCAEKAAPEAGLRRRHVPAPVAPRAPRRIKGP